MSRVLSLPCQTYIMIKQRPQVTFSSWQGKPRCHTVWCEEHVAYSEGNDSPSAQGRMLRGNAAAAIPLNGSLIRTGRQ